MYSSNTARIPTPDETLRAEQIHAARTMTDGDELAPRRVLHLAVPRSTDRRTERPAAPRNAGDMKRPPLKGHEAFLKALELSNADVVVEKVSSGQIYYGKIRHSDKFTITLRTTAIGQADQGAGSMGVAPSDRVLFKHDISEFYTTTAPRQYVAPSADVNTEEGHAV